MLKFTQNFYAKTMDIFLNLEFVQLISVVVRKVTRVRGEGHDRVNISRC